MPNFAELIKLRDRVLKYPRQYRQEFWGYGPKSSVVREQRPACKTAGCLAYNVLANHRYHLVDFDENFQTDWAQKGSDKVSIQQKAQEILELDLTQQSELFSAGRSGWSGRARIAYARAKTFKQRAQAAALAIDDFIAKYRAIEAFGSARVIAAAERYLDGQGQ